MSNYRSDGSKRQVDIGAYAPYWSPNAMVTNWALSEGWMTTWPVVSGMPNRAAGCRLVGNGIVPWIAYAIFAAIQRTENTR